MGGCAAIANSFKPIPGQTISRPYREMVAGTSLSVSVRVMTGDFRPWCDMPDAGNEIGCIFYYGWLDGGGLAMEGPDGYRGLRYSSALGACNEALWSVGPALGYEDVTGACARALLAHRWMDDADIYEEEAYD